MASPIETKLKSLGVTLPDVPTPAANYVPYLVIGDMLYVSGQISKTPEGELLTGKVGDDLTVAEGAAAAKVCAINLLAAVKAACGGDLGRLVKVVKLGGFVNSHGDFAEQPQVINGASDFLVEALGIEIGSHTRAAVSAGALPFGVAVEIEGVFQIK